MLNNVSFKFGVGPERLTFKPELMTILVGPNNSGKSRALNEIYVHLNTGYSDLRIIDKIEVRGLTEEEIGKLLASGMREVSISSQPWKRQDLHEPSPVDRTPMAMVFNPIAGKMVGRELEAMQRMLGSNGLTDEKCSIICHLALRLGGLERLTLTSPKPVSNLQEHPTSMLMALFQDEEVRNRLRNGSGSIG